MWIPKNLIVKNLMSHVESKYEFQQGTVTLFIGNNLDDPGQKSNGSGKSVLTEALSYIYTGSGLKKVVDSDLVRDGEKSAFIEHILYNTRTKQELKIQREIFIKGSSTLKIFINGEDQKDKFPTVPEGNKFLLELIGISRKDLLSYYIISKEKYVSFYSSGDAEKKEAISRFSKADLVDGVDLVIKPVLDGYDNKITLLNGGILKLNAKIETYNEQLIEEEEKDYKKIRQDQIDYYNQQIDNCKMTISEYDSKLDWYHNNTFIVNKHKDIYDKIIKEYGKQLSLIEKVDYSTEIKKVDDQEMVYKGKERKFKSDKENNELELKESNEFLTSLENKLAGIITCPECSHEFLLEDDFDVEEGKSLLPDIKEGIRALEDIVQELGLEIQKCKDKYKEFDKKRDEYRVKSNEIKEKENIINSKILRCKNGIKNVEVNVSSNSTQIINLRGQIKDFNDSVIKYEDLIKELKKQPENSEIDNIKNKINEIELQVKEKEGEISVQEEEKFKHEQWVYNFKRFKSFLANKSIKNIEGITNLMLKKMGSNLQVLLEGYGLLKNGDLREKITANVLRNGFNEGSFFKKSGGERGRIEIATISAMQQLINISSLNGGLDLLIVDEILESVDGEGIKYIAVSAGKLGKTMNMVTHVDIPSNDGYKIVTIEKKNKISKIYG